ncbi:MAG TPA: hypothetical protein VFU22_14900 [Roseiflexaceae bacterium]|nr:hypothetical protein [Roseiflexaceae bacterium]
MTEEQRVAPPENGSPPPSAAVPVAPARPSGRGGCLGRFFAALLVIVITTFLALLAGAGALLWLGFTPDTPQQLGAAQAQLATLQAQSDALQARNDVLQTEVAGQAQRFSADHETLDEIHDQLANIEGVRDALRQEREQSASQNATLVAEARGSRDAVALFATAEASRAALLAELDRRSARVERFLQRLSDISSDTALDLNATQLPLPPTLSPAQTTISELSPTPTSAPTPTSVPTEPPTPTASSRSTATPTPAEPSPTLGR